MTIKVEKADTPRGLSAPAPPAGESGIVATMMRPVDVLLRYQGDLLRAMEPEAMRWFARRQEDVQAGLQALERLSRSVDIDAIVEAERDWLKGTVERLQADLATLSGRWALPAAPAVTGEERPAGREARPSRAARADENVTPAA